MMTEQPTDPEQPLVSPSAEPLSAEPLSAEPPSAEPLSAGPAAADPAESAQDAVQLLVRAVGQLPPAERDRVYAWLISAGFRASAPDVPVPVPAQLARRLRWALRGEFE